MISGCKILSLRVIASMALLLLASVPSLAQEVYVDFTEGFIGTTGKNNGKVTNISLLPTLELQRIRLSQASTTGAFGGAGGNDLTGSLTLYPASGSSFTITGSISWRDSAQGSVQAFGFTPDAGITPQSFTYSGGTYTIDGSSNFGLTLVGSGGSYADGDDVSGNNSTSGLIDELNIYLGVVEANAPIITGPTGAAGDPSSAISITEPETVVGSFSADMAVTWSLSGGDDVALLSIDPSTGTLSFNTAPDFGAPADAGGDNIYNVEVQAQEVNGYSSTQSIAITILEAIQDPIITGPTGAAGDPSSSISITEPETQIGTFTADVSVTWSLSGGADIALFSIDANSGELTLNATPDFSAPADAGGDNVYDVDVMATDGNSNTAVQSIAVTVLEAQSEPIVSSFINVGIAGDPALGFDCALDPVDPGIEFATPGICVEYTLTVSSDVSGADASDYVVFQEIPVDLTFIGISETTGFDSAGLNAGRIEASIVNFVAGSSASLKARALIN